MKVRVALRNYASLAEYPVKIQKMIAERAWYEGYVITGFLYHLLR